MTLPFSIFSDHTSWSSASTSRSCALLRRRWTCHPPLDPCSMFRIHFISSPAFAYLRFRERIRRAKSFFASSRSCGLRSFRYVKVTYRSPFRKLFSMWRLVLLTFSRWFAFSISSLVGLFLSDLPIHPGALEGTCLSQISIPPFIRYISLTYPMISSEMT